jgi:hypothetical protein
MHAVTPIQTPSKEVVEAFNQLKSQSFRQKDGGTFNPDGLTPTAKADPVGQIILSCSGGRLGVEGYRELKKLYPNGIVPADNLPNFTTIARTTETVCPGERQIVMVVCGGQTGVDQAALKVAEALQYEMGGVVPKFRKTTQGPLDVRFPMTENHCETVDERTQHNFTGADGTLALFKGNEGDGTLLTMVGPLRVGRPLFVINLNEPVSDSIVKDLGQWLERNSIRCLNIGGPRQPAPEDLATEGDVHAKAVSLLHDLMPRVEAYLRSTRPSLAEAAFPPRV